MKITAKRKGLTLVEIVISIAIYGVLALLIMEIMTLVNTLVKSTDQMTKRLSYEAKYADNLLTQDEEGHPFSMAEESSTGGVMVPSVRVTIDYDISNKHFDSSGDLVSYTVGNTANPEAGAQDHRLRRTTRSLNIDGSGNQLRAAEYTTNYNETASVVYHEDTNYKFLTFNKAGHINTGKPTGPFNVNLSLQAEGPQITKIIVKNTTFDDGSTTKTFTGPFTNGQTLTLPLYNSAPASGGTATDTVTVEIYENVTSSLGNNLGEKLHCDATLTYYTAIQVGDFTNYYTNCDINYLGSQNFGFPHST